MAILWKPTGTLDINTAATDLPEQTDGGGIVSGAMVRCKNLRLDRHGVAELRYGSSLVSAFTPSSVPELILDVAGHRYIFAGSEIFYDETLVSDIVACADPVFSPLGGSFVSLQTVTITCETAAANIYYTTNGNDPTAQDLLYTVPVEVPANSYLKAVAIDPRGFLSDSAIVTEFYAIFAQDTLITETDQDTLITETDSDTLTTEGP